MSADDETAAAPAAAEATDAAFDAAMRTELDRRIAALAEVDESTFGAIGRGEWALTVLVSIVVPLLLVWVFA